MENIKKVLIGFLFFLFSFSLLHAEQIEIVKLTPPKITPETIESKIVCFRPKRNGGFNISVEKSPSKIIVHCYGHGGWGWTTLFGSVEHAIKLFQECNCDKSIPIRVVGSGCIGLACAIELSNLGYHVVGISTKTLFDTPSWKAAGSFSWSLSGLSPESKKQHSKYKVKTFIAYQQVERGEHSYLSKDTVRLLPSYTIEGVEAGLSDIIEAKLIPEPRKVILDFGNWVMHPNYLEYQTYFMNTTMMMQQMFDKVEALGIPVEIEEITSFDNIEEPIVFNCTGLGARELNHDDKLTAYCGHLILLKESAGTEHMNYMIDSGVMQDEKEEDLYMFPKDTLVTMDKQEGISVAGALGGTFIPDVDKLSAEEFEELNQREFEKLLDRHSIFFYGLPFNFYKR